MKLILSIALIASANAFVVSNNLARSATAIRASTSEDAIENAMNLSKLHGPTSKEARVAWDIVEELNASDNSAAYAGGINDEECEVDGTLGTPSQECIEYDAKLLALSTLLEDHKNRSTGSNLAESVRPVQLGSSSASSIEDSAEVSSIMVDALNNAKVATEKFGVHSSEAKLAWEALEEISSNDFTEATKKHLLSDDDCLVEKLEACEAIEELQRALYLNKDSSVAKGRYQG